MQDERWCFCLAAERPGVAGKDRAALLKANSWKTGEGTQIITVSFLDGDPGVQEKVKQVAKQWTKDGGGPADLTFDFRNAPPTDIRISFKQKGSWSYIGTTCSLITDQTAPTMNYGWLTPQSSDDEIRRVVLHEFGHAIGLIHEHQNPKGGIQWNRPAVIASLSGPPNNWTAEQIETNMFKKYEEAAVLATPVDDKSIMMYPFPASWTLTGISAGLNKELSPKDIELVKQEYS